MKNFIHLTITCLIIIFCLFFYGRIVLAGDCLGAMDGQWSKDITLSITENTIWTMAESPYIVTDILQIYPGIQLSIEEGVIVKFDAGASMRVGGSLSLGSDNKQRVIFTINDDSETITPQMQNYVNKNLGYCPLFTVEFTNNAVDNELVNLMLEHGQIDVKKGSHLQMTNIALKNAMAIIVSDNSIMSSSELLDNSAYHLYGNNGEISDSNFLKSSVYIGGNDNKIFNNMIQKNITSTEGLFVGGESNQVLYNRIISGQKTGLSINCNSSVISNNTIYGNNIGVAFGSQGDNRIENNNIYDNNEYNLYSAPTQNFGEPVIDVSGNYWGATSDNTIGNKIYDYYDDMGLSKINYNPSLSSPANDIPVASGPAVENNIKFTIDERLSKNLAGNILLQVESHGEAWYVYPKDKKRYYLGRPADAFSVMRRLGLGVTHNFITGHAIFPDHVLGKILLDVEQNGEAYYIYPKDKKAYYLGRPEDAFRIMRELGLGITNENISKVEAGE